MMRLTTIVYKTSTAENCGLYEEVNKCSLYEANNIRTPYRVSLNNCILIATQSGYPFVCNYKLTLIKFLVPHICQK
jgi:hypothetical protein